MTESLLHHHSSDGCCLYNSVWHVHCA
ncbi:hypothetical protein CFP56_037049 [Quercus suber]|uniref:Uncharacterized protein n=1 Tax=Quercus suber TaxID=58331 RepID=A0AAW0J5L0_QUESU